MPELGSGLKPFGIGVGRRPVFSLSYTGLNNQGCTCQEAGCSLGLVVLTARDWLVGCDQLSVIGCNVCIADDLFNRKGA